MDRIKEIAWTEKLPPNEQVSYDYVIGITPFGRFLITWKGWKEDDAFCIDESPWGEWIYGGSSLEGAKDVCKTEYETLIRACLI